MSNERSNMGLFQVALLLAVTWIFPGTNLPACTIAVVSGKATEDGRPLLWKNRDTDSRRTLVQVFTGGKYRLMAVIDAGQTEIAREKDKKRAYAYARRAIEFNPDNVAGWKLVGTLAHELRDKRQLVDATARLTVIAPNSEELKELQKLQN
jgi:hypothetical protein